MSSFQPHLIDKVLQDVQLDDDGIGIKNMSAAAASQILLQHPDSPPHDNSFHYQSLLGKMNYLEKGSRSNIAYAVHQCACFSIDLKVEHAAAVHWLRLCLRATRDKGMIFCPNTIKRLEVFVDADFKGNWSSNEAHRSDTA